MSDSNNQQGQQSVSQGTTGSSQMGTSSMQQGTTMQQAVNQQQMQQQANNNGGQHQQTQGQNQMQQLQVVQQQIQNPTYLPQIYNTQGQQLIMPGNILHQGLNPHIQVIAAGKSFQPNQLTSPHMLSAGNMGFTAIPTSGSPNNQTYILGQFINPSQSTIQQGGKHGEIPKVISPQIGTQLPQGLWASPHTFLTTASNPIFIRGTQPDQMFIQQQQAIQTNSAAQQHFSMPLTAGQIPTTSIGSGSTTVQGQQQQNLQHQNQQQGTAHVTIKAQAALQPKPPLQIQPQPQHQLQQQQQQIQQIQQVTMAHTGTSHQIQMIPQTPTSQSTVIPQSISIQQPQILQQTHQQQPRQLTILPQSQNSIQSQQMQFIQQAPGPQPIRPNYTSSSVSISTTQAPQNQVTNPLTTTQQRPKIRKPSVRGASGNGPQQPKPTFPRASSVNPMTPQQQRPIQPQGAPPQLLTQAVARVPVPVGTTITQHQPNNNSSPMQAALVGQPMQIFPGTSTQSTNQNLIITPAPSSLVPPRKDSSDPASQKGDTEKENSKNEDHDVKQKLPKAMVKPQVLTHVIEGFVIQEASEPFPMSRSLDLEEPPKKKASLGGEMAKCEMCGKVEVKAKFKRKRFCSSICSKNMKAVQLQKQQQQMPTSTASVNTVQDKSQKKCRKWGEEGDTDETSSSAGDNAMMSPQVDDEPKVNPMKWGVSEVVDFVKSLPGCTEYAGDFAEHEIDGQALLLLKEDHLMSAMNMKLGPALKLCSKIEAIRAGFANPDPPK